MIIRNLLAVLGLAIFVGFSADRVEAATSISNGETKVIFPLNPSDPQPGIYEANISTTSTSTSVFYIFDANGELGSGVADVSLKDGFNISVAGWYDEFGEFGVEVYEPDTPESNASIDTDFGPNEFLNPFVQQFKLEWSSATSTPPGTNVGTITFTFEPDSAEVPEIDAAAGMGSLAALGAMLAFCRSRRRSA